MQTIYILTTVCTLNHIVFVGSRFAMLLFAIQQGATPTELGVLGGLFAALSALTLVSVGRWADRVGALRPMLGFNAVMTLCVGMLFFWNGMAALYVSAALSGLVYNSYWVCGQQTVGKISTPGNRAAYYGISTMGLAISSFVGPVVAGFAIDHLGHAPALLGFALLSLAPLAMLWAARRRFPARAAAPGTHATHAQGHAPARRGIFDLLRFAALRRIFIVSLTLAASWDFFTFLMPIYGTELHLSASTMGVLFGAFTSGVFAIRIVLPALARRFTQWQLLLVALFVAGTSYALFVPTSSAAGLMVVGVVLGLALGLQLPLSSALLFENAPPDRGGEAIGMRVMLANISATGLPLLAGVLSNLAGVAPVFILVAVMLFSVFFANRGQWRKGNAPRP